MSASNSARASSARKQRHQLRKTIARLERELQEARARLAALPPPGKRGPDTRKAVVGPEEGQRWDSITAAARDCGVSWKTMFNRCRYGHLGGGWWIADDRPREEAA